MSGLSVVMISAGVDQWDTLTLPAIQSLKRCARENYELIVMDNGGKGRGHPNTEEMIPFAEAMNMAVREATGERLLLLNNDITARGDWMSGLYTSPYCGPKLLKVEGVEYIEGWCVSIDRDLWHMLNGFNEAFINSWEDVDLAWRLRRLGVLPKRITVPMAHIWGATRHAVPGSNKWDSQNRELFLSRVQEGRFRWSKC